jgi:N-acetylmuramic acid 6-phosphate etherase
MIRSHLKISVLSFGLAFHFNMCGAVNKTGLVDLSNVATENKGEEYAFIERLLPENQAKIIWNGMKEAVNTVEENKDQILQAVMAAYKKLKDINPDERRFFVAGAGTSGRLAIINAFESTGNSEINSMHFNIAGGIGAFQKAVEGAEDNEDLARQDVEEQQIVKNDVIMSLSASGRTPYAIAYIKYAKEREALTISLDNSPKSDLAAESDFFISNHTGPECPRGSTRMKSGTSQYETLRLFTLLLAKALEEENIEKAFKTYVNTVNFVLENADKNISLLAENALKIYEHLSVSNKGRIIYLGSGVKGLLGTVDGSELRPTYTFSRVGYSVPDLETIVDKKSEEIKITKKDIILNLGGENENFIKEKIKEAQNVEAPIINIDDFFLKMKSIKNPEARQLATHLLTNMILKTLTTQFAILSGWILEGEMINLDPQNPNKKLITRRVQMLKNLKVVEKDEEGLKVLEETKNNLALAVIMKRKNLDINEAQELLKKYNGNVVNALKK